MIMSQDRQHRETQLPDPEYYAGLYTDVPVKRFFAWCIDTFIVVVLVGLVTLFALLIPLLFLSVLFAVLSFFYRWGTIAAWSATPGMHFMAIELRDRYGHRLDTTTAFLHTAGYAISVVTVPLQLISIVLMLTTQRRQGLTDLILGTAALNRRAE